MKLQRDFKGSAAGRIGSTAMAVFGTLVASASGAPALGDPPVDLSNELIAISSTLRNAGGFLSEAYLPPNQENADAVTVRNSILIGTVQAHDAFVAGVALLDSSPHAGHPMVNEALQGLIGARAGLEQFGVGLALGDEDAAATGLRAFEAALETARLGQPLFAGCSMNVVGERVDGAVAALHLLGPGRADALALLGDALAWRNDPNAIAIQVASIAELTAAERSMLGLTSFNGEALLQLLDDPEACDALDEVAADPGFFVDMAVAIRLHRATTRSPTRQSSRSAPCASSRRRRRWTEHRISGDDEGHRENIGSGTSGLSSSIRMRGATAGGPERSWADARDLSLPGNRRADVLPRPCAAAFPRVLRRVPHRRGVETGIVDGHFPPRALRHVLEWTSLRRQELMDDWVRAQTTLH